MKKVKILGLAVVSMGLLSGCSRFTPDETAISIKKDYGIVSYVKETFDKEYYNADELEATIDQEILEYNTSVGSENIEKTKFEVKDQMAELKMEYATGDDYASFNDVTMFSGDVLGAYYAGYDFAGSFQSLEKGKVTADEVTGNDILNSYNYGIVILEEAVEVQVPGNIVYASSNVTITGKRSAVVQSVAEEQPSTEAVEHETNEDGVLSIAPVSSGSVKQKDEAENKLAYILYE